MEKYQSLVLLFLMVFVTIDIYGQDTLEVKRLSNLADSLINEAPEESLIYAKEARLEALALDNYELIKLTTQKVSEGHSNIGNYDSVNYFNDLRIHYAEEANDIRTLADLRTEFAMELKKAGKNDEAKDDFAQALRLYRELGDQKKEASILHHLGITYNNMNQSDRAMEYYTQGMSIYHALGDYSRAGDIIESMAIVQKQIGDFDKAIELHAESRALFLKENDTYGLASNANNLGIVYKQIGEYDKALEQYSLLNQYGIEMDHKFAQMSYAINSAILYNKMGNYVKAEELARLAVQRAEGVGNYVSLADAKKSMAEALYHQRKYPQAIRYANESIALAEEYDSPEKEQEAHVVAKDIYLALGNASQAVFHLERTQVLKDSIFQIDRIRQVNEMQTKYETEKKDAEIVLLNKEAELDDSRKRALWGGIGLITLSSLMAFFGLNQRSKRKRAEELEKRKRIEQELEFKKKELTAKVLQLASKNEFLNTLQEEVAQLSSSVDASVNKTSARINRMIHSDEADEDEWKQFSKEFTSIHQDFVDRLISKYGSFTSGEMRLVSLLKMNLSSKEIANILRVSDERYRLRKKLNLETGQDLAATILAI